MELPRVVPHKRVYRIGDRRTGTIESLIELEQCIDRIRYGHFPRLFNVGHWIVRKYIIDPASSHPVPVATVSSHHVFTLNAFRTEGVNLIRRIIEAIANGSLTLTASESDADHSIGIEDLAYLNEAYDNDHTTGYYTVVGHIQ